MFITSKNDVSNNVNIVSQLGKHRTLNYFDVHYNLQKTQNSELSEKKEIMVVYAVP